MSIRVVVRRRARPGQGAALIEAAVRLLEARAASTESLDAAWVFQGLGNPDDVLVNSEWESREAFLATVQLEDAQRQLDALSVGPLERYFFQPIARLRSEGGQVQVLDCAILHGSPAAADEIIAYTQDVVAPAVEGTPGFLLRLLARDEDDPGRVLIVRGWDSLEHLEEFRLSVAPRYEARWFQLGARVERFIGNARAQVAGQQ